MRKSFSKLKASFSTAVQNGSAAGSYRQPEESHHTACPPEPDAAATNDRARSEKQTKAASASAAQPTVRCRRSAAVYSFGFVHCHFRLPRKSEQICLFAMASLSVGRTGRWSSPMLC